MRGWLAGAGLLIAAACGSPAGFVEPEDGGSQPPPGSTVVRGDVEYRAVFVTARADGVDAVVTVSNRGSVPRTLVFPHTCGALLRAYFALGGRLAWDQADGKLQCDLRPYEVPLAPGETRTFRPGAGSLAVLGLSGLETRYAFTTYLEPAGEAEVELPLGEVALERPDL